MKNFVIGVISIPFVGMVVLGIMILWAVGSLMELGETILEGIRELRKKN